MQVFVKGDQKLSANNSRCVPRLVVTEGKFRHWLNLVQVLVSGGQFKKGGGG